MGREATLDSGPSLDSVLSVGDDWGGDGAVRTLVREAFPGNLPPAPASAILSLPYWPFRLEGASGSFNTPYPR